MKVLIINGSPRKDGNTSAAAEELVKTFDQEGIETKVFQIGNKAYLTNGFIKKTQKTPRSVLELAKKYREDHMRRHPNE